VPAAPLLLLDPPELEPLLPPELVPELLPELPLVLPPPDDVDPELDVPPPLDAPPLLAVPPLLDVVPLLESPPLEEAPPELALTSSPISRRGSALPQFAARATPASVATEPMNLPTLRSIMLPSSS
jgi:hypothetical protein